MHVVDAMADVAGNATGMRAGLDQAAILLARATDLIKGHGVGGGGGTAIKGVEEEGGGGGSGETGSGLSASVDSSIRQAVSGLQVGD